MKNKALHSAKDRSVHTSTFTQSNVKQRYVVTFRETESGTIYESKRSTGNLNIKADECTNKVRLRTKKQRCESKRVQVDSVHSAKLDFQMLDKEVKLVRNARKKTDQNNRLAQIDAKKRRRQAKRRK